MKCLNTMVTFSEFPDEIALCINITNCPFRCSGCHSPELWEDIGTELTKLELSKLIESNKGITLIGFMGGDYDTPYLNELAEYVKNIDPPLKVGWYSGNSRLSDYINTEWFDYIKLGPYDKELGGLDNPNTNQRMYKVIFGELVDCTYLFWKIKEEWKAVKGYELLYSVSNLGKVKSLRTNKILSPSKDSRGYCRVQLYNNGKKVKMVHRLVAEAFLDGFNDNYIINHKDNNPSNNIIFNLELCSNYYNNHYLSANIRKGMSKKENYYKPILQYSLDGKLIKEWSSYKDITEDITKNPHNILTACKGYYYKNGVKYNVKSCCGYIWKFK